MDRKETTEFLGKLLKKEKFSGMGKYWASEVSIDYGTTDVKRVDFMQFEPIGVCGISAIEKGSFTCYEIKSCKADFKSGFGQNFIAEKKLSRDADENLQRNYTGNTAGSWSFSTYSGLCG